MMMRPRDWWQFWAGWLVGWPGQAQAQAWVEKGPRGRESHGTARLSRDAMRHDEAS